MWKIFAVVFLAQVSTSSSPRPQGDTPLIIESPWHLSDADDARHVLERVCSEESQGRDSCSRYRSAFATRVEQTRCFINYSAEPETKNCTFTVVASGHSMSCSVHYVRRVDLIGYFDDRSDPSPPLPSQLPPRRGDGLLTIQPPPPSRLGPTTLRCSSGIVDFVDNLSR